MYRGVTGCGDTRQRTPSNASGKRVIAANQKIVELHLVVRDAVAAQQPSTEGGTAAHKLTLREEQLYIREARRMVGMQVMTQAHCQGREKVGDVIGLAAYNMDSHNVQRYVTPDCGVQNEGDIGVPLPGPYEIAYGALVPKRGQADNLIVPVCVSASHIAFGSIRMEPVFMVLAHSAATAAVMAIDRGLAVQDVPYADLRARLLADGQVLEYATK